MSKLKLKQGGTQGREEEKTHNHNNKPWSLESLEVSIFHGGMWNPREAIDILKRAREKKKGSESTEKGPRGLSFQEARFFSLPVFALSRVSTVLVQPSRDLSAVVRPCVPFSFSPTVQ
jgi:hypothetical protein